jgi:transformation/transcription domain-associated protein
MHRLGFSPNATIEYRKLSIELAEVIIKWELQRVKEENDQDDKEVLTVNFNLLS